MHTLAAILFLWNTVVFLLYGTDKQRAKKKARRIPERTLLLCSCFIGGIGALAGMFFFRHKTQHTRFRILVPIFFLTTTVAMVYLYRIL
ncbi:DUF1294 domain-containing protein [Oscillospiraceae bacterium MB08-C2-2]|nr:DUF1294 domain-containing protein [Oscillospiraceae bacterium MB08-C2-2]